MLKVLELFCGAGSFSVALDTLNIKHEIVGFSDIRDNAIQLFSKIHNKNPDDNLGDVKNVKVKGMDVDLLVFGSPCQSFTRAGKQDGGLKGSNTKSSLMWEAVRIMNECKPKWIVWENVPDAINKKNMPNFVEYMSELDEMNYNTYYKLLNAHELGSAQKRVRLFAISVRKDIDNGKFKFIEEYKQPKELIEYIEEYPKEYSAVEESIQKALILDKKNNIYKIKNNTKLGYLEATEGDAIDTGYHNSKTRRGRVQKKACQTLLRSKSIAIFQNNVFRYLTPLEYWRLQEMPESLYKKVEECDFSLNNAYDVVGGVINQLHLKTVFESMSIAYNWELKNT